MPRDPAQGVEVRLHLEVAVALRPGGHGVALDRVHLHVDGQQVVARLGAVPGHLVEEVGAGEALALQPALHVDQAEQDGVDLAGGDGRAQLLERQVGHRRDTVLAA